MEKRTQGIGQLIQVGELFRRELLRYSKDAAESLDKSITENEKFSAEICYTSKAAEEVRNWAWKVALMYIDFITIEPGIEEFRVPPFQPLSLSYERFTNALHDGYDHLNNDEESAARALDRVGISWFRNVPNADGYKIPLPLVGTHAKNFFPDFVAIGQKTIWFIEPKGNHLLSDAIRDKLINNIHLPDGRVTKIILIAKGKFEHVDGKLLEKNKTEGITLIRKRGIGAKDIAQRYDDYSSCFRDILKE